MKAMLKLWVHHSSKNGKNYALFSDNVHEVFAFFPALLMELVTPEHTNEWSWFFSASMSAICKFSIL